MRTLVAGNAHDGMELGAALGELRPYGVSKPMGCNERSPHRIKESGRAAGRAQSDIEEIPGRDPLPTPNKEEANRVACTLINDGALARAGPLCNERFKCQ